ncbi:MAG: SDR family oxidoreductase [Verrucomicrobiales bacterium]
MSETSSAPLSGKVAFVSGGSRGIGRATALKLASAGSDVAILYYNSHEEAESLCGTIRKMGLRSMAVQADVADPGSVGEAFDEFRKEFDRVDFVVSNAALGVLKPALEMTRKHFRRCMETNALALNTLAQNAVPMMAAGGSIVALTSLGSERAIPNYAFIGASKAALEALARGLAQELGPKGIRVNCVSAGVVDTDALKHFPNRERLLEEYEERTPLGPTLSPSQVADAVYLLCLPEAGMVTGHTLFVDGGYAISG